MRKNARREYLNAIRRRYLKADRVTKKAMLEGAAEIAFPCYHLQNPGYEPDTGF